MTNTTETYWSVDGVSLQTLAFNITTLGGDREAPPDLRGEDIQVAYMPGTHWVPKVPDSREVSLGMWVLGTNEDGTIPTNSEVRRQWEINWRKLRKLLWTPRRQVTLGKRFWVPTDDLDDAGMDTTGLPTQSGFTLIYAEAKAQFSGGLSPVMTGQTRGTFTVDLFLADPFFYSAPITVDFSTTTGGSNPGPTQSTLILGDDRTNNIEVDFEGPLTSPRIINNTEPQELYLRYASTVPDDESATIRVKPFSATHYPSGDPYKVSGNVQHRGDLFWMYFEPGEIDLELDAQAGTGVAQVRYQPAWL